MNAYKTLKMTEKIESIRRIPASELLGSIPIERRVNLKSESFEDKSYLQEILGVRRVNENCIEITSYSNLLRNIYASTPAIFFLIGVLGGILLGVILPSKRFFYEIFLLSFIGLCGGLVMYLFSRIFSSNSRGVFIRFNKSTQKIYFVMADSHQLVTLNWRDVQPMAGYIPSVSRAGYTALYPLLLMGVDWSKKPLQETYITCGNLGHNDHGKTASELWSYLQCFMEDAAPVSPMLLQHAEPQSRWQAFLSGYREWAKKFREDLSIPEGKRKAWWLVPGKVFWLITMVFPDSIGEVLEYGVPYTPFPKNVFKVSSRRASVFAGWDTRRDTAAIATLLRGFATQ